VQSPNPKENQNIGFRCTTVPFDSSQRLNKRNRKLPSASPLRLYEIVLPMVHDFIAWPAPRK